MDSEISSGPETNPFYALSFTMLSLVSKLRMLPFHHAINDLQERLTEQIKQFESQAEQKGCAAEQIRVASYFLCALIDETILNTPWGRQSDWGHNSLLILLHREAQGGETFFQLLKPMMRQPASYLNLLELAYFCLSLGFQGKYRIHADGLRYVEKWRQDLIGIIEHHRGASEQDLSLNWKGVGDVKRSLMPNFPLWVIAVVAGTLLMFIYLGFTYTINCSSDHAYKQLMAIAKKQSRPVVPEQKVSAPVVANDVMGPDQYKILLSEEIAQNIVTVVKGPVVRISNAFVSGSDQIKQRYLSVLTKLAQGLRMKPRRLEVIGHTDDQPIFSVRFPSNWHLSQARAKHVAVLLMSFSWLNGKVSFSGRGDNEPVVSNETAQSRSLNRRIDIHIR